MLLDKSQTWKICLWQKDFYKKKKIKIITYSYYSYWQIKPILIGIIIPPPPEEKKREELL